MMDRSAAAAAGLPAPTRLRQRPSEPDPTAPLSDRARSARCLVGPFGGYLGALKGHKITGLLLLALFAVHILYTIVQIGWKHPSRTLLGPDSMVFQWRDVKDIFRHLGWISGQRKAPAFGHRSWWEKFDYRAVRRGFMIVGIAGLVLYDPVLSSECMPGWLLNVALGVHRIEAVLATAHIFVFRRPLG
jgi:hypothetical protein